ncbi:MAG: glycosyltransferase family 2 protein [Methylobacterium mesophilicum]|nr:glycosyltransferase family 2 protein [Methylobacterium mesophilicum]
MTTASVPEEKRQGNTLSCAPAPALDLTIVILTYNEEIHIARAIASVRDLACPVVVVDSFSKDRTTEIAREMGARVLQHRFVNQARQFQWAMDHAGIDTGWILRLDADEIVEPALVHEIATRLPGLPAEVTGINLRRRHVFMGRWVRHGGRYPLLMLRLFRRGMGHVEDRWMDEHIVVDHGRVITFAAPFTDDNRNNLSFFIDKHNRYATREAIEVVLARRALEVQAGMEGTASRQAAVKRWIKTRIYNRLPFPIAALGYFLYRYVVQFGFLDGATGTIYHVLQGFWYRFLVGAKVLELERETRGCSDRAALRAAIVRLTGHDLDADSGRWD